MALSNDIARLSRVIDDIAQAVTIGLRSGRGLSDQDRRAARAELERCIMRLGELRSRLGASAR